MDTLRLLLLTGSKFSDFVDFLNFQVSFCGHGRTFWINSNTIIDTWPVPHHSSDLCVMITFQARNTSH